MGSIPRVGAACVAAAWLCCAAGVWAWQEDAASPSRIRQLIAELGHDDYFVRERAQAELARLGLDALDALTEAEGSDDIEIAARARYLIRRLQVEWATDQDSPEVKELVERYQAPDEATRREVLAELAALPENRGVPALCRLVRFERSPVMSKLAALALISHRPEEEAAAARAEKISEAIGASTRPAAEWLRVYLRAASDTEAACAAWESLLEAELQARRDAPHTTRPEIVLALWQQQYQFYRQLGRQVDAAKAIESIVQLPDNASRLPRLIDWLLEQEAWEGVEKLAEQHATQFAQTPLLLYQLAHARSLRGEAAKAQEAVEQALQLNPKDFEAHYAVAQELSRHRLGRFVEGELRLMIQFNPPGHIYTLACQQWLSELLHDRGDHQGAAAVRQEAVAAMEANINAGNQDAIGSLDPAQFRARMHYFLACHAHEQGRREDQIEHLKAAMAEDPTDADVLIALHRIADLPAELRDETMRLIRAAAEEFRNQIQAAPEDPQAYNQLAWLLANTDGDKQEALQASKRSLELKPNTPAYLDTLGRCYYALGDLQNAVKYQRRAVALDPDSGLMRKQLALFEEALGSPR
ncbi:MAG: tetratricopeptide repeat protein [Pirellulales bacterium]|nr:tetratricopeptide repeat protein [Pirellulales bacterium]